jgi:opacity protein-like surface antigen
MRKLGTLVVLGLVAMAFAAAPAAAQGITWAGSLYGGYAKIMESDNEPLPVPGGSFGVRGNAFAMLDPVLGVGAELGYYDFGSNDVSLDLGEGLVDASVGYSAFQATAQAIARGVRGSVRPFGTLGLGYYSRKATLEASGYDASESDGKFGVNLGGGVQFKPSASSIGFGLEARWHSIFDGWVNKDLEESSLDIMTIMAGINFN